jgi:hypothetical protein
VFHLFHPPEYLAHHLLLIHASCHKGSWQNMEDTMSTQAVTKPEEKTSQAHKAKVVYKGLCSTCKNASTCTFPRDVNRPVMHCDEFDGYEGPKTKVIPRLKPEVDTDETVLKGLCRNCEERHHCTYPKPAGGVWHCDEYR